MDDKCPDCGGGGMIMVEYDEPECCGNIKENGGCCGNAIMGYRCDWEPCMNCDGTGIMT